MLTSTTATMLRSSVARASGLPTGMLLRSTACPYSTSPLAVFSFSAKLPQAAPSQCTAGLSLRTPRSFSTATRPSPLAVQRTHTASSRSYSIKPTSDAQLDATAAAAAAARATNHASDPPLDWTTFFKLRKARRRWQLGFSVATALAFGYGGTMLLVTGVAEPVVTQIPLDPVVTMGLMTLACAGMGWLVGPSMGSFGFNMLNAKYKAQMAIKESIFFARVKKNRVDPTTSSMGNPVPDYYGEKISSVAGYRRWLKDQRAFNKKRTTFL